MHVQHAAREQYRPECLTPTVRGSDGSGMLWAAFCWRGLDPLVPLEGRVTAVIRTDHLYPMVNRSCPDWSGAINIRLNVVGRKTASCFHRRDFVGLLVQLVQISAPVLQPLHCRTVFPCLKYLILLAN